ncbi:hypothetical protein [Domibacillus robiginosus]|uniref:hypothetical protein n=1 Tax=Domibacillus robiginosus TaxID=1071054 RepID=UPI00067B49E4|nr:hypothetical protein [Domibacillus robiginosus]
MTIRDLFKKAFGEQEDTLVYGLLDLLQRGVVDMEMDEESIPFEEMDNDAIRQMKGRNALGFQPAFVYAITANRTLWLLVAAHTKEQAIQRARQELKETICAVACCSPGYTVERNGRAITMRDMLRECESLPALVGVVDVKKEKQQNKRIDEQERKTF